jgi:hypothetical protein
VASATPSIKPIVIMLAPKIVAMYTGNRLCTSSEDVSMNRLPKPSAQTLVGKQRSDSRAAGEARSMASRCLSIRIGSLTAQQNSYSRSGRIFDYETRRRRS